MGVLDREAEDRFCIFVENSLSLGDGEAITGPQSESHHPILRAGLAMKDACGSEALSCDGEFDHAEPSVLSGADVGVVEHQYEDGRHSWRSLSALLHQYELRIESRRR